MEFISEEKVLNDIRDRVKEEVGAFRFRHTEGVVRAITRLGEIYLPKDLFALQVAALLHDVTKEYDAKKQLQLCEKFGIIIEDAEKASPKVWHAHTGAHVAKKLFPCAVDDRIFSAIDRHTTGEADMTLFEKLLFLSDFIEENRTYESCVRVRDFLWQNMSDLSDPAAALVHLDQAVLMALDATLASLLQQGAEISTATVRARNFLLEKTTR